MPSITLTDPVTLTTVASGLIATNNANLRAVLNAGIDGANLKGNPSLTAGQVPQWNGTQFVAANIGVSAGIIEMFGGSSAPTGYVLCDGASYLRADGTHDALFAVIGTTYGNVDGTHFNVPDLRGRIPVGFAASGGHTDVSTLNNNDGQAVANRRPKHRTSDSKGISDPGHRHNVYQEENGSNGAPATQFGGVNAGYGDGIVHFGVPTIQSSTTGITLTGSVGSGVANDALDTPSYLVINYIIKL